MRHSQNICRYNNKYFENATTCSIEYLDLYVDVFARENIYLDILIGPDSILKGYTTEADRGHFA